MNMTSPDLNFLRRLRLLSMCEGISTLALFGIAMPLKYFAEMPMAVRIVGSIHGFLFVCLAVMFLLAIQKVPMPRGLALAGMVAAIFPFGPFLIDRRLGIIAEAND
jgi:integral membrane protein